VEPEEVLNNQNFAEQGLPLFDLIQAQIETAALPNIAPPAEPVEKDKEKEPPPAQTLFTEPSQVERIDSFLNPGLRNKLSLEKEFEKVFNTLCYSRDRRQVFYDFAEVAAIWQYTALYDYKKVYGVDIFARDSSYDALVAVGKETSKRYSEEELGKFSQMTVLVIHGSNLGGADFLGDLYNKLELTGTAQRQAMGEFFTPYSLGRVMARMSITDDVVKEAIKEKGCITFNEPACGAGGLLIAAAERIEHLGYDPKRDMFFVATDISRLCFNMAYIQMSALGIPGIVKHGNTLTLEMWEARPTPALLYASKIAQGQITEGFVDHLKTLKRLQIMDSIIRGDEPKTTSRSQVAQPKRNEPKGFAGEPKATEKSKKGEQSKATATVPKSRSKAKVPDLSKVQLNLFDITLTPPEDLQKGSDG